MQALSTSVPPPPGLQALHPGNFAFVMATGIVSVGLRALGADRLAVVLAVLTVSAWLLLLALSALRLWRHAPVVVAELGNPRMVFSYFTLVAATDVVGLLLLFGGHARLAVACWAFAFGAWSVLLYLAFSVLTFRRHESNVNIIDGGWLIAIVGTQSLVLLGARIAPQFGDWAGLMMVEVHMLWGLGLVFYGIFVTLFCYRIFFLALEPREVGPLVWVVMGAAAISANAGTTLIVEDARLPFLLAQRPFIDGVTMMLWAWATWWIPMLVIFGLWKHVHHRVPLRYEPGLWSMVFPLGMYSVASVRLGLAADFLPLQMIASAMIWVAFVVWLAVSSGLAWRQAGWMGLR